MKVCDNNTMKTAIVTSFDKNYIMPSMVSLKSLSDNYHGAEKLDVICLVSPDILDMQDEYVKDLNANNLNVSFRCSPKFLQMIEDGNAHSSMYISSHCNHRIFLGSTLPDYDKAIYLDSDIVVLRDISTLLNYPMRNKLMAIVEYNSMNVLTFADADRPYFNNGVFIADLNYWRESNAEEKMNEFTKKYGPTTCPEQDAMNYVFIDVWSPLPFAFNSFHYWLAGMPEFAKYNTNPMIVHFVGPDKPWLEGNNSTEWEKKWQLAYISLTGKVFNE